MGIINRLFRREIRADDAQIVEVQMDDELKRLLGVSISEETAMNIPAVAACVNFICGKIAELPIRLYKDDLSGKAEEVTNDARLGLLNDETGDLLDPFQMKFAVVRDFLLHGSGYLFPEMRGNEFVSLRYVDKRNVQFIKNEDPIFKTARCVIGTRTFFEDEIIRICRNSRDGVTGRGIVDENREILETAYKEILFEKYLVRKGGNKKGFLQTDQRVEQAVIDDIRKKWEEFYANNESTMLVLNNGLKFVESSNTSVEMQLDESIRRNNEMICQLFGLSSRVISGTAGDDEYVTAIKTAVIPVCTAFQAALNKGFLLPSQRKQYYWQFDMKQLLKGDILKRYQAYSTALKDGWLQKDEVRYEEDYEPYGFNFITLSLSDVLLDMDNRVLYTPNTNQAVRLGEGGISLGTQTPDTGQKNVDNGVESGIIEERSNDGSHYKKR